MKLIVGLGNPGKKYEKTRHNIGFTVLKLFGPFVLNKKFNVLVSKAKNTICIMPQSFMNNSGVTVQAVAHFYKIKAKDIWVFHDEIDLPLGTVRLNFGSSSAGHKGVESIINALGTKDFYRIRMGIMSELKGIIPTEKFVLQNFPPAEKKIVNKMIERLQEVIPDALKNGIKSIKEKLNK